LNMWASFLRNYLEKISGYGNISLTPTHNHEHTLNSKEKRWFTVSKLFVGVHIFVHLVLQNFFESLPTRNMIGLCFWSNDKQCYNTGIYSNPPPTPSPIPPPTKTGFFLF
jgi:hypothetical protein